MSGLFPLDDSKIAEALRRSMHDYWRLFLAEGIALGVLGIAAIILPHIAGLIATFVLGWVFLSAGVIGVVFTLRRRQAPGFGWSLLSAFLAAVVGGVLLWNPMVGMVSLTYVLIAYFIADGVLTITLAINHRRELSGKWEWILLNGVIDLVLAAIIVSGLPDTAVWVLGLLVGIDMLFGGFSLIVMALAAQEAANRP